MELTELINHPERLDRDTLYELRSYVALYPYFQTARLLMLQNLYLLHDPTFDEELRRAAIYITDRKVIFQLVEAAHYRLNVQKDNADKPAEKKEDNRQYHSLIIFLSQFRRKTRRKRKRNAALPQPTLPLTM